MELYFDQIARFAAHGRRNERRVDFDRVWKQSIRRQDQSGHRQHVRRRLDPCQVTILRTF